jgi:hypothetical protein
MYAEPVDIHAGVTISLAMQHAYADCSNWYTQSEALRFR